MALQATNSNDTYSLSSMLASTFRAISKTFTDVSKLAEASRRTERLMALSDEALALRGLRRDEVVNHAFRDYFAS